jgi:hypothetical protein
MPESRQPTDIFDDFYTVLVRPKMSEFEYLGFFLKNQAHFFRFGQISSNFQPKIC